jgi:hypothetical protein
MPKQVSAANAAMSAVEYAAALYGVRAYRQQSRMFRVPGAGGTERPMFMGQWKDKLGVVHYKGIADLLLTPTITRLAHGDGKIRMYTQLPFPVTVALWCECKSGGGRLKPEQIDFRDDVTDAGAFWIQARDSADVVIDWFDHYGVRR